MNNQGGREKTQARWADRLEAILRGEPKGMTFPQIIEAFWLGAWTVRKAIAASAARGGVLWLRMPTLETVWWHKDNAAVLHARTAELRREWLDREAVRSRRKYWNCKESMQDAHEAEKPFVHRIIPAHLAKPLRPAGPCSVWRLAA